MGTKEKSCVFTLKFTKNTMLQMGFTVNVPDTAGFPYALSLIIAKNSTAMPTFQTYKNALPVFLWAYYEYILKPYDFHKPEKLSALIMAHSSIEKDAALKMAQGLIDVVKPPRSFMEQLAEIPKSKLRGFIASTAIFYYLEHDKYISPTESNTIEFFEVLGNEEDAPDGIVQILESLFKLVDRGIKELAGGKNLAFEV